MFEEEEWTWKNDNDETIQFVQDDETYCFPWGTTSSTTGAFYFPAKCSISGLNFIGYDRIPTITERLEMKQRLLDAFNDGSIAIWDVLRVSFHDAAAYKPPSATNANTLSDGTDGGTVSDDSGSEIETIIRGVTSTRTINRVNIYCCNINNIKLKKNNSNANENNKDYLNKVRASSTD